jgi:hypothetical protein
MRNLATKLGLAVICAALLYGVPAQAWYDQSGNWHSDRWHREQREQRVFFRDNDRVYLGHYIYANGMYCPPGTRPHHRHCEARPGNVVFYRPGTAIPSTVVYQPLPYSVTARLAAPPPGAVYVRANDNVYLINRRDRTVIDAVNLLSDIR